jgi:hypothetical protein
LTFGGRTINQIAETAVGRAVDGQAKCPLNVMTNDKNHAPQEIPVA